MIKNVVFLAAVVALLSGCIGGEREMDWQVYIYPDKNNTKRSLILEPKFNTIEECRTAAINKIKEKGLEERADYKCGMNCEFHEGMKLDICEEMRK